MATTQPVLLDVPHIVNVRLTHSTVTQCGGPYSLSVTSIAAPSLLPRVACWQGMSNLVGRPTVAGFRV